MEINVKNLIKSRYLMLQAYPGVSRPVIVTEDTSLVWHPCQFYLPPYLIDANKYLPKYLY